MTFTIVMLVVFFICIALMWNEGLWSNAITLINIVFAAMLAVNYSELLATWMDEQAGSYTYIWDFIGLWVVFVVSFAILRAITDNLSRYRVRFKMPVEHAGRVFFAGWAAWTFVCFTCMTLHTAPLSRTPFRGSFQSEPMSDNFLGFAPGRLWLGFMQSRSRGALSQADQSARSPFSDDQGMRVFDPKGEFILKYGARRNNFDKSRGTGGLELRVER